jgi:polysaccharide chain length determinant protein (PEP-CTERM system associated)
MANNELNIKRYMQLVIARKSICILTALAVMTIAVIISYSLPKIYEAKSVVFIEKSVIADLIKGIAVTPSIEDKIKVLTYAITSRTLLEKVIDELDMNVKIGRETSKEELLKEVQKNLQVKQKDKESLFIITYRDKNPKIARDFVNTLVSHYIEQNVSSKREDSYGASKFLSEQADNFKQKLEKAENAVNEYKKSKGIVVGVDPSILQRELDSSQQRLDEIRVKRAQLETRLEGLRKDSPLAGKINQMKKRLSELKIQYTDSYPEVVQLKSEIESLQSQMKSIDKSDHIENKEEIEKVTAEVRVLKQAEDNLRNSIASNRNLLRTIPTVKAEIEDLERERNTQKDLYSQLVNRQGQSEVSRQMEVQDKSANYRIVDPAVMPVKPVSPDRIRIMLMGLAAGLGAAFALVFLLDTLDHSIKSLEMVKQLGFPVLAVIPVIEDPLEKAIQRKKDIRLYLISFVYFGFLVACVLLELLGLTDNFLNKIVG